MVEILNLLTSKIQNQDGDSRLWSQIVVIVVVIVVCVLRAGPWLGKLGDRPGPQMSKGPHFRVVILG